MKKRASDEKCALNGMPCHKYIIRNLETELDMLEFERAYADVMFSHDYTTSEIEVSLTALSMVLPKNSKVSGKTFSILGDGPDMGNFVESLLFDSTIPTYGKCTSYYKKFDKQCHACSLCEFSNRYNGTYCQEERKLIRYMLESANNLSRLQSQGLDASKFLCSYDITEYGTSTRSYPFSLHKNIVMALLDKKISDSQYDPAAPKNDICNLLGVSVCNFIRSKIRYMKLPDAFAAKTWIDKVLSLWDYQLANTVLINDKEADELLCLLNSDKEKPAAKRGKSIPPERVVAPSISPLLNSAVEGSSVQEHKAEQKSGVSCEPLPEPSKTVEITRSEDNRSSNKTSDVEHFECDEVVDMDAVESEGYISVECRDVSDDIAALDMGDDLIYIPRVNESELSSIAVSLDTQNALIISSFESAVLADGYMSIELLDNGKLLIWVFSLSTFFYSDLSVTMSGEILSSLLSRKMIAKLSYSTYPLYAFAREHGIALKNVVPLQSMHYLTNKIDKDYVSALMSYGIPLAKAGVDYKATVTPQAEIFYLLPRYNVIWRKLKRSLKEVAYEKVISLTEALGYSYGLPCFHSDEPLFTMPTPGIFKFREIPQFYPLYPGYLMMYKLQDTMLSEYLKELLIRLVDSGRFRNLKLQLISLSDNYLFLFVSKEEFEYLTTVISKETLSLQEENSYKHLHVDTAYLYLDASEPKTVPPKKTAAPKAKTTVKKDKPTPAAPVTNNEPSSSPPSDETGNKVAVNEEPISCVDVHIPDEYDIEIDVTSDTFTLYIPDDIPEHVAMYDESDEVDETDESDREAPADSSLRLLDARKELLGGIISVNTSLLCEGTAPEEVYDTNHDVYTGASNQYPY